MATKKLNELRELLQQHRFIMGLSNKPGKCVVCICGYWYKPLAIFASLDSAVNQYELHLATEIIKRVK